MYEMLVGRPPFSGSDLLELYGLYKQATEGDLNASSSSAGPPIRHVLQRARLYHRTNPDPEANPPGQRLEERAYSSSS